MHSNWISQLPTKNRKIFSQGGQDGIIESIVENIYIENKFCVEFGYDTPGLTGGCGPNCANLVINRKWNNLYLGGSYENPEINLYKHFLTTENIVDIFKQYNVPLNLGYISIDVDSTDLWLLDNLLEYYRPSFFSSEYNVNIPHEHAITFPNNPAEYWQVNKVFGASLKCFDIVAKKYGYSLVYAGCQFKNRHHDAFFVRNDLIDSLPVPSLSDFDHTVRPLHENPSNGRHLICLDYEHYLKTNNEKESQEFAIPVTSKYLT
jgi:hypothetical protein